MNTGLAQATLAWLLTYALHSTVLLAATWFALRSRRFSPMVADVAWKTALVGGLITATAQGIAARRPAGSFFLDASSVASQPTTGGAGTSMTDGTDGAADDAANTAAALAANVASREALSNAGAEPSTEGSRANASATATPWSVQGILATLWLIAAFALVAWYVGRRLILVGRLGDRRPVVDGSTLSMLEELRRDTQSRAALRLTSSVTISSPVALGGEICLPAAAIEELEPAQLRAMLAHELAHLERRDPQWLAFACVLERAFFFQPLNRLARRGIQENAEFLADEWAARHSGGVQLAKALVKVAEWMQSSPLGVPVAGFAEEKSQLTQRVTRLLDGVVGAPKSKWGAVTFAGVALVATAAFAPGVGGVAPSLSGSAPEAEHVEAPIPPAERRDGLDPKVAESEAVAQDRIDVGSPDADATGPAADTAIVRAVMQRLRDESADVRRAAADALGRMRHPMSIDALVIALDDLDGEVRRAALHALGNYEHVRVPTPPIRRMLENSDAEIRAQALRILAEQRDRASISAITRLLDDAEEDVRNSALEALDELEAPVPDEVLAKLLNDRSSDVRQSAAHFAGERQMVNVVPQLIRALEDRSSSVRESAAYALTEMRTPASHEALRRALTHKDSSVRRIAVEYFGEEVDK